MSISMPVRKTARFGISMECAADYHADTLGPKSMYEAVNDAVCNARANRPISKDWKNKVNADYNRRKNNK